MHLSSVAPLTFFDCGLAQSLFRRVSRLGPTVPVVPAAASVWHEPQPPIPVKTAFPAAGDVPDTAPACASAPASSAARWRGVRLSPLTISARHSIQARCGIAPRKGAGTIGRLMRTRDRYRMRAPSTGREVIIEAEPGRTYRDRETGEEL